MALRYCPECGKEVSLEAERCPHCGVGLWTRAHRAAMIVAVVIFAVIGWQIFTPDRHPSSDTSASKPPPAASSSAAEVSPPVAAVPRVPVPAYGSSLLTCTDVGKFAAAVVEGKRNGKSGRDALSAVSNDVPTSYPSERKILRDIVHQIYFEEYAKHLSADGARDTYEALCEGASTATQ